jgi:hypothetical protein
MKNIAVIGVGTAGILSLSHILGYMPKDWAVTSIFDPSIPILGVGETAGPIVLQSLFKGCNFTFADIDQLDGTFKYGSHFINWRENDVKVNVLPPEVGIHFNNFKLKEYALPRFAEIHGDRFRQLQGSVSNIVSYNDHADIQVDSQTFSFDWIIDCRGYPTDYTDYSISDVIPVNHCLVNMIPEPGSWEWTYHTAHKNGWMFGIPLQSRQGWGYLYNDTITAREDAVDDIAERFNTPKEQLTLKEFSFKNYFAKEFMVGKVLKNGNRALFFEPIEAMSGYFYDQVMKHFFDVLLGERTALSINTELNRIAEDLETFIAYLYHGGSTYDSEFWKITKAKCSKHIQQDERFNWYMDLLKDAASMRDRTDLKLYGTWNSTNWIDFDKNLGYHYVTSPLESKDWYQFLISDNNNTRAAESAWIICWSVASTTTSTT